MKALRRSLEAVLMLVASVGLTLIGFEIALRTLPIGSAAAPHPDAGPIGQLFTRSTSPELGYEHARDVHVRFPRRPARAGETAAWEVWIDANGLRRNGRGDPLASELRGICLGDSTMFGAGLNDAETIPAQLSAIVSERLGRSFECLNLGVANYTTAQEVALFRHVDALRYRPSVVVLGIFTNDFKVEAGRLEAREGESKLVTGDAPAALERPLASLLVVRLAAVGVLAFRDWLRRIGLYPQANGKPLRPEEIAAVYGALDELRAMLEPRGIPLVILLFPRDWQLGAPDRAAATERQRASLVYCRRHGLRCVDLLDRFWGHPVEDYFRPGDDSHPHAEAARISAALLADALLEALRAGR
ncbi:MAG TPA: SGNH/GDSL hydrolase family protein [Myxococcota bacterium]